MQQSVTEELVLLVEQHFSLESQMAELLQELSGSTRDAFGAEGLRGPTPEDLEKLRPLSTKVTSAAEELKSARKRLLSQINRRLHSNHSSLSSFINSLAPEDQTRLDSRRRELLEKCAGAQSDLIQNQATIYYTHDFYRRYVAGVMENAAEPSNYGRDGAVNDVQPGNLCRKSC